MEELERKLNELAKLEGDIASKEKQRQLLIKQAEEAKRQILEGRERSAESMRQK